VLGGGVVLCGCASHPVVPEIRPGGAVVGHYRGRVETDSGETRKFRVVLFAELPDRIHAEVIGPLGSTQLILDGGDGVLAVTAVRRGIAWVGPSRPEALAAIVGVPLPLEQLVRALLIGEIDCDDCRVLRSDEPPGTLPEQLEVRLAGNLLSLELKRLRALERGAEALGRGRPPDGVTVHPLGEIDLIDEDRALTPGAAES
jgi:hypothetical protein